MYYIIPINKATAIISKSQYDIEKRTDPVLFRGVHDDCIEWLALNTTATIADIKKVVIPITQQLPPYPNTDVLGMKKP